MAKTIFVEIFAADQEFVGHAEGLESIVEVGLQRRGLVVHCARRSAVGQTVIAEHRASRLGGWVALGVLAQ